MNEINNSLPPWGKETEFCASPFVSMIKSFIAGNISVLIFNPNNKNAPAHSHQEDHQTLFVHCKMYRTY